MIMKKFMKNITNYLKCRYFEVTNSEVHKESKKNDERS